MSRYVTKSDMPRPDNKELFKNRKKRVCNKELIKKIKNRVINIKKKVYNKELIKKIKKRVCKERIKIEKKGLQEEKEEKRGDSSEEPCIFRVHQGLRHVNEEAYTPMLVSIGPYHRGHNALLPMEKHKERYLKLLLQCNNNERVEDYLDFMKKLEERVRKCYANPLDHINSEEFVKMMLNDACFVIGFLYCMHHQLQPRQQRSQDVGDDPIVKVTWMRMQICRDLMLLENQLPFFVLSEFYGMSSQGISTQIPILRHLVMYPIVQMLPRDAKISTNHFENRHFNESKHFLDMVHNVCRPRNADQDKHSTKSNMDLCIKMPTVIELEEAGVTFDECKDEEEEEEAGVALEKRKDEEAGVPNKERKEVSMFDIAFENSHFKIPKIKITDSTETFFRNIIAYEQHSSDNQTKYFSDYTYFMDLLINSKEDVSQLRRRKIIENMLGDDEEVAVMFNKLGNGRFILPKFYYSKLCSKVNAHCDKWWNKRVAALKRDYFKNIWVTVATFAAAFLLLLTVAQTVIALITILSSSPSPR